MIQFTKEEVQLLKERAKINNSVVHWLIEQVSELRESAIVFPQKALATWSLFYYCPKHSVVLDFNIKDGKHHICPIDGEIFEGEPYDGAWWCILLDKYAKCCYYFSILHMITGEDMYFVKAKEILLEAAKYYPDYEAHGSIPYNGPGKALAQTISDASWIHLLAKGYDLISEHLSQDEINTIKSRLFEPCAEFLIKHRSNQIHNHEVIINSAIAVLGIILERKDLIDFAVHEKYGLIYQAEHGFLKDNFWFEGSVHYHYYALEYFMDYEKFVRHTPYTLLNRINYREMIKFPHKILQPDYHVPAINDAIYRKGLPKEQAIYEFAYSVYKDNEFAFYLNKIYTEENRNNIHAFLYGVDILPNIEEIDLKNYHNDNGSGLTVLRGKNDKFLLVKHSPYGGEHDHYDRLGISLYGFGSRIAPDLGTTGYGAKLHYDYFKNTGSHNTIVINEENQPPAVPKVIKYVENTDETILLDTEVAWDGSYKGLDSYNMVQWDEESYKNVKMRRIINWNDDYFIEAFIVGGVENKTIDWVLHVCGNLESYNNACPVRGEFSAKKPFKYLTNLKELKTTGGVKSTWKLKNCSLNLYSFCNEQNTIYYGDGPDNPSTGEISYFINRITGNKAFFANIFEVCKNGEQVVKNVSFDIEKNHFSVNVERICGKTDKFSYEL